MMDFEQAYEKFMQSHIGRRSGERKGRLISRNFHGEKLFLQNIWWVLKGNLDNLHPEYEIMDWRSRSYFADFAWKTPWNFTLLFEIKGFAKHIRDMDRNGFDNDSNRELFLQGIGYRLISLTYDNVANRPELCTTLLRLFFSQFQDIQVPKQVTLLGEKEVIKFALRLARPFRPIDVSRNFQINYRTTMRIIRQLLAKGWIVPVITGNGDRVVWYRVADGAIHFIC